MARSRSRDHRSGKSPEKRAKIRVSSIPYDKRKGLLRFDGLIMRCALGKSGIGILKREGDGKTPLAAMEVLFGFYNPANWPMMQRQPWMLPSNETLGWCDAPGDINYNRAVVRPYGRSNETLTRKDSLYDCVIVMNWNMRPRARNRGSAVFLHLAREGYQPTEGCIAVSRADMMRLVKRIKPGTLIQTVG